MHKTFVSSAIQPVGDFDAARMQFGEPGIPEKFRWQKLDYTVAGVLESAREYDDCKHGSGERYMRRHGFRLGMADGTIWNVVFQRTFGKTRFKARWWLRSIEVVE